MKRAQVLLDRTFDAIYLLAHTYSVFTVGLVVLGICHSVERAT